MRNVFTWGSSVFRRASVSTTRSLRSLWTLALVASCLLGATGHAAEPLEVTTRVEKVVRDAAGIESFVSAESANPGDILVYRADYANRSEGTLREVSALLPIPPGVTYVAASAQPAAREATTDGKTFFALPASSAADSALPPVSAWRALRWAPRDLAPGARLSVELRVRVAGPTPAPAPNADAKR